MSSARTTPGGDPRLRLLIVDDVEAVRDMLSQLLSQVGYEVETATNAEEALQLVEMVRWDGLILDFDLPDLNGLELYRRIIKNTGRQLPVLFFTGRPHEVLKLGLGGVPWAGLVPKPCSGQELLAALEQCLRADSEAAPAAGG